MIKEAYVSFEVAKLLKEKGFDEPCRSYFIDNVDYIDSSYSIEELSDLNMGVWETLRPTQQMTMAWLREVHKIFIGISPISSKGYGAILCDVGDFDDFNYIGETDYFFHPEEAVEAALKYALENLI